MTSKDRRPQQKHSFRLGVRKARKILDFLARRVGYDGAKLEPWWNDSSVLVVSFWHKLGDGVLDDEVMLEDHGNLRILGFSTDSAETHVLKKMISLGKSVYAAGGPKLGLDGKPWKRVLLDDETCLETLVLKCDLA